MLTWEKFVCAMLDFPNHKYSVSFHFFKYSLIFFSSVFQTLQHTSPIHVWLERQPMYFNILSDCNGVIFLISVSTGSNFVKRIIVNFHMFQPPRGVARLACQFQEVLLLGFFLQIPWDFLGNNHVIWKEGQLWFSLSSLYAFYFLSCFIAQTQTSSTMFGNESGHPCPVRNLRRHSLLVTRSLLLSLTLICV